MKICKHTNKLHVHISFSLPFSANDCGVPADAGKAQNIAYICSFETTSGLGLLQSVLLAIGFHFCENVVGKAYILLHEKERVEN